MFSKNGYSLSFFNDVLGKFLEKKELRSVDQNDSSEQRFIIFKLPFIGKASVDFKKDFGKLMLQKFKIDIKCVYTTCKIGQFFSLKSASPSSLAANVVYRFKCSLDANISYIGKTDRHLMTRMKEHLNPNSQEKSAVTKHISQCAHCQDNVGFDNFEILRHCRDNRSTFLHETFLIRKHKPSLNTQLHNRGGTLLHIF